MESVGRPRSWPQRRFSVHSVRSLLAGLLALTGALVLASAAHAGGVSHELTRTSGPVTATVTWVEHGYEPGDVHLTIARDGTTLLDEDILDQQGEKTADWPQALRVRDLDGDDLSDLLLIQPQEVKEASVTPPVRLDLYLSRGDS